MTPLDYMILVMRDESQDGAMRLDAAKSAAPYVHARLSSTELHTTNDNDFKTEEQLKAEIAAIVAADPTLLDQLDLAQKGTVDALNGEGEHVGGA